MFGGSIILRVANAAAVFDAFFLGSHQQEPFRQSQSGLVASWLLALGDLLLSQRTASEHAVKQACLSSCCIVRGVARKNCLGSIAWASQIPNQTISS